MLWGILQMALDFANLGELAKIYTWIHIALGWFLSGIGVAAITSLVKRE